MSSRASPIPPDAFERPSSPSPSVRSARATGTRPSSTFSPFRPVILPSTYSTRPGVYRGGGKPPPSSPGSRPSLPFGEKGTEEGDDAWETASVSSWGGERGREGEELSRERAFHPRLRDLRLPRPNVRKPEHSDDDARGGTQDEDGRDASELSNEQSSDRIEKNRHESERGTDAAREEDSVKTRVGQNAPVAGDLESRADEDAPDKARKCVESSCLSRAGEHADWDLRESISAGASSWKVETRSNRRATRYKFGGSDRLAGR